MGFTPAACARPDGGQSWNGVVDNEAGKAYNILSEKWEMGKYEKLLARIREGHSDANIPFSDLCGLLLRLGFEERVRGSHHVFTREGVEELINLQRDARHAKGYQVRQVRTVILRYRLGEGA